MESRGDDIGFTGPTEGYVTRWAKMKMGLKRWVLKDWKSKLFITSLLVFGLVYAGHRLDRLWENGMVLRGGLIEGAFILFCVTAVAVVIVLGSVWLCRRLVIKYGKASRRSGDEEQD